jgi:hypothetical protein
MSWRRFWPSWSEGSDRPEPTVAPPAPEVTPGRRTGLRELRRETHGLIRAARDAARVEIDAVDSAQEVAQHRQAAYVTELDCRFDTGFEADAAARPVPLNWCAAG